MNLDDQEDLFSPVHDLRLVQLLVADLHDDLFNRIARFRQLDDLSQALGSGGTLLTGGEVSYKAWVEARTSFINGNFIATVMLCQSLAEYTLASFLEIDLQGDELPERVTFREILKRCSAKDVITKEIADDLVRLMELRNPLSHFTRVNDRRSLSQRTYETRKSAEEHLFNDASFAIRVAIRVLSLPPFRIGPPRHI